MTPEGRVKAKVKRALGKMGAYAFMPVQRGLGASALDFYCCLNAQFIAIETKVPNKKLTVRQAAVATNIASSGGMVFVIREDYDIHIMQTLINEGHVQGKVYDRLGTTAMYEGLLCNR